MYSKEFGEIKVTLSKRSRYIRLSVRPFRGLEVSAPKYAHASDIERVIDKKSDWIRKQLSKIKTIQDNRTIFDLNTNFETKHHRLVLDPSVTGKISSRIKDGLIKVKYPEAVNVKEESVQKEIRTAIEKALRIEANEYIPHRVKGIANKHGLRYKNVVLKNITTRWGSCSSRNNLNFNIHIMRLPGDMIDYIILHELAHTVVKNHSPKFWSLLGKLMGNNVASKAIDKELNKFKIGVY